MQFGKLAFKLPISIGLLCVLAAGSTALVGYLNARATVISGIDNRLQMVEDTRAREISTWLNSVGQDIELNRQNETFLNAVNGMAAGWRAAGPQGQAALRKALAGGNGATTAEGADTASFGAYLASHDGAHAVLEEFRKSLGFYDVFLIDGNGTVVYTSLKEPDFATNLMSGPYRDSGLGKVFRKAMQSDGAVFEDFAPYAPSNGAPGAFFAATLKDRSGGVAGVLAVQLPVDILSRIANDPKFLGDTGQVMLIGPDGLMRNASRFDGGPAIASPAPKTAQVADALQWRHGVIPDAVDGAGNPVIAAYGPVDFMGTRWAAVAEISRDEILAPVTTLRNHFLMIMAAVGLVVAFLSVLGARSITRPLEGLRASMLRIQDKDFASPVDAADRRDELGDIGRTLTGFRDRLAEAAEAEAEQHLRQDQQREVVSALSAALERLSRGDLTGEIGQAFPEDYERLRGDFNAALGRLKEALHEVSGTVSGLFEASTEIAQGAEDLSRRTENQAATLEETSAAMEELTVSVNSAAEGTARADQVVSDARRGAEQSGQIVLQAVDAMNEIEESSKQISQIIGVIDDIAFQTNLLALNAGVEAARAGDAGRGFAVVASEVRALAQRSSEAAREIKELISTSSRHVQSGVTLVGNAGSALQKIVEDVTNISGLVSNIATSAREQSIGLSEITGAVAQLDQVTQQNAAMVEQTTAASHTMRRDATRLSDLVGKFHLGTDRIDTPMRGAEQGPGTVRSIAASGAALVTSGNAALAAPPVSEPDWQEF